VYPNENIVSLSSDKINTLDSNWCFIGNDDIRNSGIIVASEQCTELPPHLSWKDLDKFTNYNGLAWYRINFFIDNKEKNLSLLISFQFCGSQFYLNGQKICETRKFDINNNVQNISGKPDIIIIPDNLLRYDGKNVLAIRTGVIDDQTGFDDPIKIGPNKLIKIEFLRKIIWYSILAGINIFLAIFFLLFYFHRRENYYLYFSLLSCSMGLWIIGYHGYCFYIFDNKAFYIFTTYVCSVGVCIFLLFFLHSFLRISQNKFSKILLTILYVITATIAIEYTFTGNLNLFNKYLYDFYMLLTVIVIIYGIVISSIAIKNKTPYAKRIIAGAVIIALADLISMLVLLNIVKMYLPISEGFFIMTIIFATALASRFSQIHTDLEKVHSDLLVLDKMKDDFLATTTHELRTPLHGIMGITESLADGTLGPINQEQKENLELVRSSAAQLNGLVSEILDFSKIRAGKVDLIIERFSPGDVISSAVSLLKKQAQDKGLELDLVIGTLPPLAADKNRLRQVLLNLLGNAIKYTEAGSILVKAEPEGVRAIRVTVSDTGPGISPEDMGRIWSPFDRGGDVDSRRAGGTGLGLAIAKEIVERHGGSISVDSAPGKGSSFSFVLPLEPDVMAIAKQQTGVTGVSEYREVLIKSVPGTLPAAPVKDAPEPGVRVTHTTARILAVDDDQVNLKVLENLCRMAGYTLTTVATGAEALKLLGEQDFDLILLDLMLPGMSGYEVCNRLRTGARENWTPVIMITARDSVTDLLRGFECGANDYITKPFNRDEVMMRIENQLAIRQLVEIEKNVVNGLRKEKDSITNLFQRSMDLKESTIQMIEWEKIIREDLDIAQSFQMKLMTNEVGGSGVDSHIHYEPLLRIGGDVYDLFQIRPGVVRIFCADATGHGIAASLNTVKILSEYSAVKDSIHTPEDVVTHLNKRFSAFFRDYQIIFSCVIADIDATTGSVTVSSAGHPDQFLISSDGGVRAIGKRGPIIGLYQDFLYYPEVLEMRRGDIFFVYTDGLLNMAESYYRASSMKLPTEEDALLLDAITSLNYRKNLQSICDELIMRFEKGRKIIDDDITIILSRID
jgi:two-component system, sensor histidine kinase ChiS